MTNRPVRVITDSAADIPSALATEHNIDVVPLVVTFGSESFKDGIELTAEQFVAKLRTTKALPTTSQPSVDSFRTLFEQRLNEDYDLLVVTISSGLSGTWNSARLAAEGLPDDRIVIIDSQAVTMQEGWIAIAAAREANQGASLAEVAEVARDAGPRTQTLAVLYTLDFLHRGGRINTISRVIGSALSIKPIIGIVDGLAHPLANVRTWKKAMAKVIDMANDRAPLQDIAVLHGDNLADATMLADQLRIAHPHANIMVNWCGSTILTHAGPGAVGIMTLSSKP